MTNRKTQGAVLGVLWLVALAALAALILFFDTTPFPYRTGFPYMPLYGAITWWFFFVIPLIGATWGFFNDWKSER